MANEESVVRRIAAEEGVDPDTAVSVWKQESGGSADLNLRGPTLPSGHKYAGHYARGPWQIMSFHGAIPEDFEGQTRWAMKHLKDRGVAGYYGKTGGGGSQSPTGMPGQPSTNDYVAQVYNRAGKNIPASSISGAPESYPGGDIVPVSGASNVNQTLPPPMSSVDLSPIDPAKYETPSFTQALATNPFVQMGLGMLGSTSPGMRGLQEGLLSAAAAENAFQRSGTDRMKMEQARRWQQLNLMQQRHDQSGGVVSEAQKASELLAREQQQAEGLLAREQQQARGLLARERMQNELYLAAQAARTAAARQRGRYNMTLPDGTTRAVELAPGDDLPEGAVLTKIVAPAKGAKAADAVSEPLQLMLQDLNNFAEEIRQNPDMKRGLGTFGRWGKSVSAVAGMLDTVSGWSTKEKVKAVFGGEDPALIQSRLMMYTLPVARVLVDPKGPLARTEQGAAARMLQSELEDYSSGKRELKDPETAFKLLEETIRLANIASGLSAEGAGAPPVVEYATPPSPGGAVAPYEDPDKEAAYQTWKRQQGG